MIASGGDDGNVILWEYKGDVRGGGLLKMNYAEQDKQKPIPNLGKEEKKQEDPLKEEIKRCEVVEDWRNKKTFKCHKGSVSDIAWCPDNMHIATCGTDSIICILNVN